MSSPSPRATDSAAAPAVTAAPALSALLPPALVLAGLVALHAFLEDRLGSTPTAGWELTGLRVLASVAWLAGTLLVIRVVDVLVWERFAPRRTGVRVPRLLRQFVGVVLFCFGLTAMVSQVWDVAVTAMLATTGVVGLVLGLALRNILADFFSGIALNFEQPFELDDYVRMRLPRHRDPVAGTVREISWRSTRIVTAEGVAISVPNSVVSASVVENFCQPLPLADYDLDVRLDWRLDAGLVESLLRAAAVEAWARGALAGNDPPKVRMYDIDGAAAVWRILYKLNPGRPDRGPSRHALLAAVHRHLDFAGLKPAVAAPLAATALEAPPQPLQHALAGDRRHALAQVALFEALDADELEALAAGAIVREVAAREDVVRAGDPGEAMFVVVAGALEVRIAHAGSADAQRVAVLGPGDQFGEMSLLTGAPRSATVRALCAAVLYEIPHALLAPLLQRRHELADRLARIVARHQRADAEAATLPREAQQERQRTLAAAIAARIRTFFGL